MDITLIVLLLLIGTALLVLEFFTPGFGVPGVSGMVLLTAGIAFTWIRFGTVCGIIALLCELVLSALAITVSLHSATKGKLSHSSLILANEESEGLKNDESAQLVGRTGVTETVLHPAGISVFDGVRLNVVSEGGYIGKGKNVRIIRTEGNRIVVAEK